MPSDETGCLNRCHQMKQGAWIVNSMVVDVWAKLLILLKSVYGISFKIQCQSFTWTNIELSSNDNVGRNFMEIWLNILTFPWSNISSFPKLNYAVYGLRQTKYWLISINWFTTRTLIDINWVVKACSFQIRLHCTVGEEFTEDFRGPFQYAVRHLIIRSHEVLKAQNW